MGHGRDDTRPCPGTCFFSTFMSLAVGHFLVRVFLYFYVSGRVLSDSFFYLAETRSILWDAPLILTVLSTDDSRGCNNPYSGLLV